MARSKYIEGTLGFAVLALFYLGFSEFLDFEARFCGFLQHHGFSVVVSPYIIGGLRFGDVVHGFSVAL